MCLQSSLPGELGPPALGHTWKPCINIKGTQPPLLQPPTVFQCFHWRGKFYYLSFWRPGLLAVSLLSK